MEISKITSDEAKIHYEIRRLNSLIGNVGEIVELLAEDQMLG